MTNTRHDTGSDGARHQRAAPWCAVCRRYSDVQYYRREHVDRKLEECRRAMEERGLKISRRKTEYLGCNEHQDAEIHLQGEAVKRAKTFTYLGSTLARMDNWMRKSPTECRAGRKTRRECMECCATGK